MKEVKAILKEMYCLKVGHDGYTSGCGYDGSDQWSDTYHGDTLLDVCKSLAQQHLTARPGNQFELFKFEALVYEGRIFVYKVLESYNEWNNTAGYKEFIDTFHSNEIQAIILDVKDKTKEAQERMRKAQEEANKKEAERLKQQKDEEELQQYQMLKKKFEK
jgi:hypothetical protein